MTAAAPHQLPRQPPRQIQLPLRKAVEIALRALRARLARSALTLLTITVAIAFLTQTWASAVCEPVARQAAFLAQAGAPASAAGSERPDAPQGRDTRSRTVWLISISLLVCLVGITNAILMTVLERFREIGTMKCLGALDSFILKLFLLESAFLGALGSAAGAALGLLLSVALLLHRFGWIAWTSLPAARLFPIVLAAFFIGLSITIIAALYPAWKASRMEPIAALRADV